MHGGAWSAALIKILFGSRARVIVVRVFDFRQFCTHLVGFGTKIPNLIMPYSHDFVFAETGVVGCSVRALCAWGDPLGFQKVSCALQIKLGELQSSKAYIFAEIW